MFHSGEFASDWVEPLDGRELKDEEVQTHGVELGVGKIWRLTGHAFLTNDEYVKPDRTLQLPESTQDAISFGESEDKQIKESVVNSKHYRLSPGSYVVQYDKKIHVPDDCVGFVYPRSRLMRSGIRLTTAVWESGYEGIGEGGLHVSNLTFMEPDMRLGQIVFARAEVLNQYDGYHQEENLEPSEDPDSTEN